MLVDLLIGLAASAAIPAAALAFACIFDSDLRKSVRQSLKRKHKCHFMSGSSLSMSSRYLTHCPECGKEAPGDIKEMARRDAEHIERMREHGRRARFDT